MKFFAPGVPMPKGNHIALCPRRKDFHHAHSTPCRPFITEDVRSDRGKKVKAWEQTIRVASREVAPPTPLQGPCRMDVTFYIPQPKCHAKEPFPPFSKGDLDKLLRSVGDALQAKTGGYLVGDDNQFTDIAARVRWPNGSGPGAMVTVESLEPQQGRLL